MFTVYQESRFGILEEVYFKATRRPRKNKALPGGEEGISSTGVREVDSSVKGWLGFTNKTRTGPS
jgi:hypothetical protein